MENIQLEWHREQAVSCFNYAKEAAQQIANPKDKEYFLNELHSIVI